MKVLNLIIKQVYFDQIISGEKTKEIREVRPTTAKKYCIVDEEDYFIDFIQYDAIRFFVGYNTDRKTALVEVTGFELVEMVDENDEPIIYTEKGKEYQKINIEYSLGKILEL